MPLSFPLKLDDILLWLAITAFILLVSSLVLPSHVGKTRIEIYHMRLEIAAIGVSILFVMAILITIIL